MSTVILISSLLNLVAAVLLILVVFTASGKGGVRKQFLLFLFCITDWALFYFFWQIAETEVMAFWSCVGLIVPSAFIPVTFYHLSLKLADIRRLPLHLWFGYLLAGVASATAPFGGLVADVSAKLDFKYWPDAGPFLSLVVAIFVIYVVLSAYTLNWGSRRHLGIRTSQMRFVLGSSAIGFIGGCTNFPLWYDIPIPPYGNLIVFIYLLMVGYGIYNRRISGIYVDLFKSFIYVLLAASLSMFYVLGRVLFATFLGEDVSQSSYWVHGSMAFLLSIILFWGIPRLRARTEQTLEQIFRKDKLTTVAQLEALPSRMSHLSEETEIFKVTCNSLADILSISGAASYTRSSFGSSYKCVYSCGEIAEKAADLDLALEDPLVSLLSEKPECIVLDQLYGEMSEALEERLVALRDRLGLAVVIPVMVGDELRSLIMMGRGKRNKVWTSEHISLLYAVGSQIGLKLQARDLERKSNEVDKLVALGTMAAGLSHEIRNPLVSIQTLASMIKAGKNVDSMPADFRDVLVRDVNRIANIVDGVATYSKNQKASMSVNDLVEIIESSLEIYRPLADASGIQIEIRISQSEPMLIYANFDQLVQVFNNLIENAIHALELNDEGHVLIELVTKSALPKELGRWVDVIVRDNGKGIPDAIMGRIFDPFTTSKDTGSRQDKEGMGLGLAITKRIIENHNGAIAASNIPGSGAKFVVSLQIFESQK